MNSVGPGRTLIPDAAWAALFTPDTPFDQQYSDRVDVRAGRVFLFQAYNLPPDRRIFACSVSPGILRGTAQSYAGGRPGFDAYMRRMDLGGEEAWTIDEGHTRLLVSLPGVYRFELEDLDMLGSELRLEYLCWEASPAPFFPVMR